MGWGFVFTQFLLSLLRDLLVLYALYYTCFSLALPDEGWDCILTLWYISVPVTVAPSVQVILRLCRNSVSIRTLYIQFGSF